MSSRSRASLWEEERNVKQIIHKPRRWNAILHTVLSASLAAIVLSSSAFAESPTQSTQKLEKQIASLEEENAVLQSDLQELSDLMDLLDKDNAALNATIEEKESEIEELNKSLKGKQEDLDQIIHTLESVFSKEDSSDKDERTRVEEAIQYALELASLIDENEALKTDKETAQTDSENLQKQLESKNETISRLQTQIASLESDYEEMLIASDPGRMDETGLTGVLLAGDTEMEYRDPATIKAVQEALNAAGYNCGTPDGIWGPNTMTGILEYQKSSGLSETGTVAKELLNSLLDGGLITDSVMNLGSSSQYTELSAYDDLIKNTDKLTGSAYHVSGKILQVVEPVRNRSGYLRLALNDDLNQVIFVTYMEENATTSLADISRIDVDGRFAGLYSYTSKSGLELEIPRLMADRITKAK